MKEEKRCMICGSEAKYICRLGLGAPRYMCDKHKHLLEEQGYGCKGVEV